MIFLDEEELSRWAFNQCKNNSNTSEIRKLITTPKWAYYYCQDIEDIEEMWRKIKSPVWAYSYCAHIKNRPEVRQYLEGTSSGGLFQHTYER